MSRKMLCIAVCVASLLPLLVAAPVQATMWEVGAGWSDTVANPSPWAYGMLNGGYTLVPDTSTFALFPTHSNALNGSTGLHAWLGLGDGYVDVDHYVGTTAFTTGYGAAYSPNDTDFYSDLAGYGTVRWTAPASGTYHIDAVFTKNMSVSSATANALVYQDTTQLFSGATTTTNLSSVSYAADVSLTAGQNLYFTGGRAATNNYADSNVVRLGLTIAQVPEPGTLALLAAGLVGLLCYAWRKQR